MSMLEWVKQEGKQNLILFVHGLKGGMETWSYDEKISFPTLLNMEESLKVTHDIACFNYFTTFTNSYGKGSNWVGRMFGSLKKTRKNLPIDEIAELLRTEVQVHLSDYENIVIIAHSMGGLISKAYILKQLDENKLTPVKGFISLAVPHSGSKLANIGGLISKNAHLKDLGILSDTVYTLAQTWLRTENKPRTKYLYAANDQYVDKKSALEISATKQDSSAVDEDHSSICKPKDNQQTVYKAVLQYILEFNTETLTIEDYDGNEFDEEYFVLKLVIADVHETITGHAKEYFYNAELARKIFTSDSDRKNLDTLYKRIKHLYQEEYEKYLVNKDTSDSLVSSLHSRIMSEEGSYLKDLLKGAESIHKKGMLHQLANKKDKIILWSDKTCLSDLEKMKAE
ncbi:MAG: hypothetical protein methR_P3593 [Methyloprofundus sp.]|nr:MAG: hypothetical protein methR_P3593 [Methyloprofundus sp.]